MDRRTIQSDKKKKKVAKLCYVVRGLYHIIRNIGHSSYFVKKLHNPDSPELRFMAYNLYPQPPLLNLGNLLIPYIHSI